MPLFSPPPAPRLTACPHHASRHTPHCATPALYRTHHHHLPCHHLPPPRLAACCACPYPHPPFSPPPASPLSSPSTRLPPHPQDPTTAFLPTGVDTLLPGMGGPFYSKFGPTFMPHYRRGSAPHWGYLWSLDESGLDYGTGPGGPPGHTFPACSAVTPAGPSLGQEVLRQACYHPRT